MSRRSFQIKTHDPIFSVVFKSNIALAWFKAVTVIAFSFIFCVDKVFLLQYQDIKLFIKNQKKQLSIELHDRKSVNHPESQFIMSEFVTEICCNPIPFLEDYLQVLLSLNKPIDSDCLVFPRLGGSSYITSTKASSSDYTKILKMVVDYLQIPSIDLTSHSLRRGGVRHRFIYSSKRWSLDKCIYWAGWSFEGDSTTIGIFFINIGLYLLTEMSDMKYQKIKEADDFSDRPDADIILKNQESLEDKLQLQVNKLLTLFG